MIRNLIRALKPGHTTLGLEITDTNVKLCEIQHSGRHRTKITNFASLPLPEGAMNDGRIADDMLLKQTVEKLLAAKRWRTKFVHFAIPSQSVMIRLLKLPDVSHKELTKIVDFELKNNIHLPFDDPHYDFVKLVHDSPHTSKRKKLVASTPVAMSARQETAAAIDRGNDLLNDGSSEQNGENLCEIMLIAVSKEVLQQYLRLFEELELNLSSIEIKAFSLNRLLKRHKHSVMGDLTLLADVNETTCDLTIIHEGIIKLTRNVPVTFAAQKINAPFEIATDQLFSDFEPKSDKVSYEGSFNDLVAEIERFMNFYRYTLNHREHEFKQFVLSSDIPMVQELYDYITNRLALNVTILNADTIGVEHMLSDAGVSCCVALGLGLRGKT